MATIRVVEELRSKRPAGAPSLQRTRSTSKKHERVNSARSKQISGKSRLRRGKEGAPSLQEYLDQPHIIADLFNGMSTVVYTQNEIDQSTYDGDLRENQPKRLLVVKESATNSPRALHNSLSRPSTPVLDEAFAQKQQFNLGEGLEPPIFSTMSTDMMRKVKRLPEPNDFEKKCLGIYEERFIKGRVDVSLEGPLLYTGLKKGAHEVKRRHDLAASRSLFKRNKGNKSIPPRSSVPKSDPGNSQKTILTPTVTRPRGIDIREKTVANKDCRKDTSTSPAKPSLPRVEEGRRTQTTKSANSDRIFEKLNALQPHPAYGENYREDRFALSVSRDAVTPRLTPRHDELVVLNNEEEISRLNTALAEVSERNKEQSRDLQIQTKKDKVALLAFHDRNRASTVQALQKNAEKVKRIDSTIEDKLREARASLPESFMFEHGLGKFVMERGAETVIRCFRRLVKQAEHTAIEHWQEFVLSDRQREKTAMIIVLQKVARGFLARLNLKLLKQERIIQVQREEERLQKLFRQRWTAAITIQKIFRGWVGRRQCNFLILRIAATYVIQRFIRYTQSKMLLLTKRLVWLKKNKAATIIQAAWRAKKGRYLARIQRKIVRAQNWTAWQTEKHEVLQHNFKIEGAVVYIQGWWRMVVLRYTFLRKLKLLKRRRIMVIQMSYRCYAARVVVANARAARNAKVAHENAQALLIQKAWHRKKAYMKVAAKLKSLEEERKIHAEKLKNQGEEKHVKLKIVDIDINMTKIHRRMYQARKLLNPFEHAREEKAALKMQKVFRGMRARKRLSSTRTENHLAYRRKLKEKRLRAAEIIQRFWRGLIGRRLFLKARLIRMATRVQARYRGWKGREIALKRGIRWYAAIKIQACFRGYWQRIHYVEFQRHTVLARQSAVKIERIARGFLCRMQYCERLERERYLCEMLMRGRTELQSCAILARDKLLILERNKNEKFDGGTQFLWRTLKERSKSADGVKPANFVKFAKECGFVDGRRIKTNTLDLAISKAKGMTKSLGKGNGAGPLSYAEFIYALQYLANTRYPKVDAIRRHTDDDAKFITFVYAHVLTDGCGDEKFKKKRIKKNFPKWVAASIIKMDEVQNAYLGMYARKIQGHIRGEVGRNLYAVQRARILKDRERAKMIRASLMLQKHQRIVKARRIVGTLASQLIQKFVDPKTGLYYYFNPRTGVRSLEKPEILGAQDVAKPFQLPDVHTEYVVMCAECNTKNANLYCEPCGDAYCDDCFSTMHSKGNKAKHHRDKIPLCRFCDYQAATRFDKFHKPFCDSCYDHTYEDTIQAKTYTHIVCPCSECGERACKWKCQECDDVYCTPCFGKIHKSGKRQYHKNIPLTYYTVKMERARQAAERDALRKVAQAEEESRRGMILDEKLDFIARKLQAIWRGRQGRAKGKKFLKQERKKMRDWYKQGKVDTETKKTGKYLLASLVGVEEILATDTPRTRARKERSLLRDPSKAMQHFSENAFEFDLKEKGELLPFKVNCYHLEVEFETLGDLTPFLKRGDRVRIGVGDFVINEDDTEDSNRKYTHQFMCLDRPWAIDDLLNADIYKLRPLPRKIGLGAEINKITLEKTKAIRGIASEAKGAAINKMANGIGKIARLVNLDVVKKAADYYENTGNRALTESFKEERTPGKFEKERRYWTENDNGDGTFYYYNRITDETVWEKPECMLNKAEMKLFKIAEAEKKAREDEVQQQKAMLEFKKKEREKKAARGGRGGRRR